MNNGIILIVNLQGKLGQSVTKTEAVKVRSGEHVLIKSVEFLGKEETKCVRKTNVSEDVVNSWISSKAPHFVKDFIWKNMSKTQRLKAWVERFDEGFGVSFQEL